MQYDLGIIGPPLERVQLIQALHDSCQTINERVWTHELTNAERAKVDEYRSMQKKYDKLVHNSQTFPADAFKAQKLHKQMTRSNEEVELILAKAGNKTHELTLPVLLQITKLERDLALSVGGSQMELIRHLLKVFEMLGPEKRELGQINPDNFPGWPDPTDFGFIDDNEFEAIVADYQTNNIEDARLDKYQAAEEIVLRWHEASDGISPHKLASAAGWIITPAELQGALDKWEQNRDFDKLRELIKTGPPEYFMRKPGDEELLSVGQAWDITDNEIMGWINVWDQLLDLFKMGASCEGLQVT